MNMQLAPYYGELLTILEEFSHETIYLPCVQLNIDTWPT